jgi:hypothetical protein
MEFSQVWFWRGRDCKSIYYISVHIFFLKFWKNLTQPTGHNRREINCLKWRNSKCGSNWMKQGKGGKILQFQRKTWIPSIHPQNNISNTLTHRHTHTHKTHTHIHTHTHTHTRTYTRTCETDVWIEGEMHASVRIGVQTTQHFCFEFRSFTLPYQFPAMTHQLSSTEGNTFCSTREIEGVGRVKIGADWKNWSGGENAKQNNRFQRWMLPYAIYD